MFDEVDCDRSAIARVWHNGAVSGELACEEQSSWDVLSTGGGAANHEAGVA